MRLPLLVVLFRNSQIQSLGHTASPGKTLHFTVPEGDGVEKARRLAYLAGNVTKSIFCNWTISNGNKFDAITLLTKPSLNRIVITE
jgi:hypothetical protein